MNPHCRARLSDMGDPDLQDTSSDEFMVCRSLSWLTLDRNSGCLNWDEDMAVGINVNTAGLAPGTYPVLLHLTSDSGDPLDIPLALNVKSAPTLVDDLPTGTGPRLLQAYPNPFNPRTRLELNLPRADNIRLTVHDLGGRLVRILADGYRPAGRHIFTWDGRDGRGREIPAGIYFCRMASGASRQTIKLVLLK